MSCDKVLENHSLLGGRRDCSAKRLEEVRKKFAACEYFQDLPITVFCAGSLARMEIGQKSDLDLFITADEEDQSTDKIFNLKSRLFEFTLFSNLIGLNKELSFPAFSNDGEYLKIYFYR